MTWRETIIQHRSVSKRTWLRWAMALVLMLSVSGCKWVVIAGYMIGGPPSVEPDFDKTTGKSMTDKGVVAAVVCIASLELRNEFSKVHQQTEMHVAHRLHQKNIKVVDPDRVRAWLDKNDDWDKPEEIGQAFGAKYVIIVDLLKYNLYEEHSSSLYRGRAEAIVSVVEIDENGEGERIYDKEVTSKYPLAAPRPTTEVTYSTFRRQFLARLSEDIGRLFYEWYNGGDMGDAI